MAYETRICSTYGCREFAVWPHNLCGLCLVEDELVDLTIEPASFCHMCDAPTDDRFYCPACFEAERKAQDEEPYDEDGAGIVWPDQDEPDDLSPCRGCGVHTRHDLCFDCDMETSELPPFRCGACGERHDGHCKQFCGCDECNPELYDRLDAYAERRCSSCGSSGGGCGDCTG